MKYTDEAINTVISDLVPQSGPANMIGLMLKQLLAERDAALARVAVLEKEIEELKGSSNHANET